MVVRPEQLAAALDRLDPRHVEVLELSLRRRVPDEALARVLGCAISEVARRRALAIDALADSLALARGEELGGVLASLLERDVWGELDNLRRARDSDASSESSSAGGGGENAGAASGTSDLVAGAGAREERPGGAATGRDGTAGSQGAASGESAEAARVVPLRPRGATGAAAGAAGVGAAPTAGAGTDRSGTAAAERSGTAPAPGPGATSGLAARAGASGRAPLASPTPSYAASTGSSASAPPAVTGEVAAGGLWRFLPQPLTLAIVGAVAVVAAAITALVVAGVRSGSSAEPGSGQTRHFVPEGGGALALPFPSAPADSACYTTVSLRRATVLRARPGGAPLARLATRTEWGSPRVLSVVAERDGWLGVLAPELRNGQVGWVARPAGTIGCVRWSLHVDLSRRLLSVRRSGRTIRRVRVAIGRPQNPTPTGRFAVTDRLRVTDPGSPYGCCVLALTGRQPRLPPGWPGGDRLAIHATTNPASIGRAVSLGCLRADTGTMRWLLRVVPLGTPVFIAA